MPPNVAGWLRLGLTLVVMRSPYLFLRIDVQRASLYFTKHHPNLVEKVMFVSLSLGMPNSPTDLGLHIVFQAKCVEFSFVVLIMSPKEISVHSFKLIDGG